MLEDEAAKMMIDDPENERLLQIYDRLDDLDVDKAAVRAARILKGLGFTHQMQQKKMSDFSGGWRMRVALARALFVKVNDMISMRIPIFCVAISPPFGRADKSFGLECLCLVGAGIKEFQKHFGFGLSLSRFPKWCLFKYFTYATRKAKVSYYLSANKCNLHSL